MKKIFVLIAATAVLAACNLEKMPVDRVSSTSMQNPECAATATNGNYAMFKGSVQYSGFYTVGNTYIRHYQQLSELKSDNILMSGKSTDPLFSDATMVDMAADTNIDYFWFISYKINYATSAVISVIQDDEKDAELIQIKGENLFMRALSHMNLIQIYAFPYAMGRDQIGVPKRTGPVSELEPVERLSVGEIYDQVEEDLKHAIKLMEGGKRRGNNGFIDVNAAKALLCRLYLYEGRWDDCIQIADGLLGSDALSKLESDIQYLYQNTKTSKEVLWCVALENTQGDYAGAQAMIGSMFYSFGKEGVADSGWAPLSEGGGWGDPGDGSGWAEIYYSQPLLDLYARYPEDQRLTKMIARGHHDPSKKMIYWPVLNPETDYAENYIDRSPSYDSATGKYTCKDSKGTSYVVETEIVNTYPRTYITINGKKQYVTVSDYIGCRTGTGGDMYPLNYMKKFSNQADVGVPSNLNSPALLRYAEVILNRAEAYAHKGDVANALNDVNTIRKRALIPDAGMFTAANMAERGYSDVLDVVLDERRLELCFEGFRVLDLQRNNRSIDRQYAGRQPYEVVAPNDPRLRYYIPINEIKVSGIPQNDR